MIVYIVSSIGWEEKEKPLKAFYFGHIAKRYAQQLGAIEPWIKADNGGYWASVPNPGDIYQYAIRLLEVE